MKDNLKDELDKLSTAEAWKKDIRDQMEISNKQKKERENKNKSTEALRHLLSSTKCRIINAKKRLKEADGEISAYKQVKEDIEYWIEFYGLESDNKTST